MEFDLRPRKLDVYIVTKFISTFFVALLLIIGIVIIFDISEKIDDFVEKEAPLTAIIFDYYVNFVPYFMNMFSPLFVFITVIFFTSKMAADSEIVAILSCGISFHRMMVPYIFSAALIALFSLGLNLFIIPVEVLYGQGQRGVHLLSAADPVGKVLVIFPYEIFLQDPHLSCGIVYGCLRRNLGHQFVVLDLFQSEAVCRIVPRAEGFREGELSGCDLIVDIAAYALGLVLYIFGLKRNPLFIGFRNDEKVKSQ